VGLQFMEIALPPDRCFLLCKHPFTENDKTEVCLSVNGPAQNPPILLQCSFADAVAEVNSALNGGKRKVKGAN